MSTAAAPVIDPGKDRIRRNVTKMADAGASQEEIEAYLQHEGVAPKAPSAAPKESLRLNVRMPSESTGALPFNRPEPTGDLEAIGNTPAALALTAGQALPGMERFEALAGQAGSHVFGDKPLSYAESLDALRGETEAIPGAVKLAVQAPLMIATGKLLPFSPAKSGAVIGAADQALSADEMSPAMRALRTLTGAGAGYGAGKALDLGATALRTLATPNTAKQLAKLGEERATSAGPLYQRAAAEGAGGATNTPQIQAFLKNPDVAEIVAELKQTREFAGVAAADPKMLDAVYKVMSDRAALAKRQAEAVTPSRPNIGRFRARDIKGAQQEQLTAMDPVMPSYRAAVQDYAEKSGVIDATSRGHDALRSRLNRNVPLAKSLKKTSPESFDDYLANASPEQRAGAEQGVLGGTKAAFGQSVRKSGIKALLEAPGMLRRAATPRQRQIDAAIRALILAGAAQ